MSKLWAIAIALGDPEDGMVVVSMQVNESQEMAVAQAVSAVYRQTGTQLSMMGVNARELQREYLVESIRLMEIIDGVEERQSRPSVVRLVPPMTPKAPKAPKEPEAAAPEDESA